jgi:hypothetical protein
MAMIEIDKFMNTYNSIFPEKSKTDIIGELINLGMSLTLDEAFVEFHITNKPNLENIYLFYAINGPWA